MEPEPEVIRQQMEQTREALTDKLERLESHVTGTVQEATCAVTDTVETVKNFVEDTVETVKDSVQETVETVKHTFDVPGLVERNPWAMLAGSAVAGFVTGSLLPSVRKTSAAPSWSGNGHAERAYVAPPAAAPAPAPAPTHEKSMLTSAAEQFAPEIEKIKGLALGMLLGFVRDKLKEVVTGDLAAHVSDMADQFTRKLGGEPIKGPVFGGSQRQTTHSTTGHHPVESKAPITWPAV